MNNTFEIKKGDKIFTLSLEEGFSAKFPRISGENLFEHGAKNPTPALSSKYDAERKVCSFTNGYYFLEGRGKVTGFTLDDSICEYLNKAIMDEELAYEEMRKDVERNRTAPRLDYKKYVPYAVGCDTGLIYHDRKDAIYHAIKNGAVVYPVFVGSRDSSNKYPGARDGHIPNEFVRKDEHGKCEADGYENVYEDCYCIDKEIFDKSVRELDAIALVKKEIKEEELKAKFEEAKRTGEPVMISKISVPEEESPLHADGEGDIVDICKMAMPDGTIKEMCFHNY